MAAFRKAIRFRVPTNHASAAKASRVIRSIKSRYRTQAFLFLAYHFFLTSPLHLDIFIMFFILVSNFMNRQQAFPSHLLLDGIQFLLDERRNSFRSTFTFLDLLMDFDTASQSLSPGAAIQNPNLRLPATCEPPSEHNPPKQAVWIVFGATGHMGRSLVRAILAHGDQCTAVGWTQENTPEQMRKWQDRNCLGLLCDVRVRETVDHVIKKSIEYWGRVDVIANSTGYGVIAACEDQDDYDLRNQFTTNFLGTLHIIQLSLPYFRAQNGGRYLVFSSTAGALGVPGLGPYCATKYAVEGLIESMLYEIDVFNIKATLVEPGHVRLDEPDDHIIPQSYTSAPAATGAGPPKPRRYGHFFVKPNPSEPYSSLTSPAQHARRMVQWLNDRQPVSAVKSAELVWQLGHCSYPPLRLILGSYAVDSIRDRLKSITEEIEDWKHLSFPVTMPPEDQGGRDDMKEEQDQDEDQEND
ncbi:1,2-dihydroxy-3-keto-5-methylthiopentene dioxygenase [Neocucurbitaria cava]|uniref:1,2-dihydroxy-3-keto-5-methylthiopentene dioxygenase n=1 Tax=Neocucurbitaria cava TaxID=798079 RepID=A0A9W9CK45_9PLEO|nr:1,2-dihydroxy-3-keto-5-methylthiopentene dioxygenase [Neocucurbitaria cava]